MVSTDQHRVASETSCNIFKCASGDLDILHRGAVFIYIREYKLTAWHIELKCFLILVVIDIGRFTIILKCTAGYIEAVDRSDFHLVKTAAAF